MSQTLALGIIETYGLAVSIEITDAMLKIADVSIVHHEKEDIALITIVIEGDLTSVQIAIDEGKEIAERKGALIAHNVVSNPDTDLKKMLKQKRKLSSRELAIKEWYWEYI